MAEKDKINYYFSQSTIDLPKPLVLRDGNRLIDPILVRGSRFYPGHKSLIAKQRALRSLPIQTQQIEEEIIDMGTCKFCHPDRLCTEAEEERSTISIDNNKFIIARTPFYYLPGHAILFPAEGPHRLEEANFDDWFPLIRAGKASMKNRPGTRFGFNAGTYLCCGGSQRHLHIQLVPLNDLPVPNEESICASLSEGITFHEMRDLYQEKRLIVDRSQTDDAFLTACWAPRFNLELLAVFKNPSGFYEMCDDDLSMLARWIDTTAKRFVVPQGGGINGFGMETGKHPFMVRIIPRLPGAVQAFMETGAGFMVISYLPEAIPGMWQNT